MITRFVAILCVALSGGFASAAEPPLPSQLPPETASAAKRIEAALEKLTAAQRKFEFVRAAFWEQLDADRQKLLLVKLAACEADVTAARDSLRLAVVDLRLLALTCAADRDDWRADWLTKLADRTQRITGDKEPKDAPLTRANVGLAVIRPSLEKGADPKIEAYGDVNESLGQAIRDTVSLFREVDQRLSKERLIEALRLIIASQRDIERVIDGCRDRRPPRRFFEPKISESPVIVLEKGERARVRHEIAWRQYKEAELEIAVTASDPSLVVPAKLKLEFEKHQFRFEYEIKAGDKVGDFTITLQPAVGDAVVLKVTVK